MVLLKRRDPGRGLRSVERGLLVRVLAVAERLEPGQGPLQSRTEHLTRSILLQQVLGNCGVVPADMLEDLGGQATAQDRVVLTIDCTDDSRVVARIDYDPDVLVALGGRPDHRRPTDVDLLHRGVHRDVPRSDRLSERIQIHRHQIDGTVSMLSERGHVIGVRPSGQQPGVDRRMQRLHSAVHHLGMLRDLRYGRDLDATLSKGTRRTPRRENLPASFLERGAKLHDAILVGHAEKRALHRTSSFDSCRDENPE